MSDLLVASQVRKEFGGLVAVNDVDFTVPEGSIVSLIGPNGAGKTTFFNMLTGVYKPTAGAIVFAGEDLTGKPPHAYTERGIARTFQNIRLFQNMTALENVLVGMHARLKANIFNSIIRTCIPTSTFSSAVMFWNRRMFWNVRPIPRCVKACGGFPVTSSPSKCTRPAVGL